MRYHRRLAALGATVIVASAALTGAAAAQTEATASPYSGRASADAMTIVLFGQTITTSAATAQVDPGVAKATTTEVLLGPVGEAIGAGQANSAEQQGNGTKGVHPETCFGNELEQVPGIGRLDITCGGVDVAVVDNGGSAHALGAEVVLEPSVSTVLETLGLQEPVQAGVDQVFQDAIAPIVEALTGTPVEDLVTDATQTVQDVLGDVLTLNSTARVVIAPAQADVDVTGDSVVSHAKAQGIRIELLPVDEVGSTNGLLPEDLEAGEPLVTITIGQAEITDTFNRTNGQRTTDTTAATAIVEFGSGPLADNLGLPDQTITIAAGQSFCVPGLEGTPLETCVNLASAGADADGNPFADGGSVQLFKGVNGGVDLATGRAATVTAVTQPAPAAAAPAGELPRTGGPAALPIVGGVLLAAAAVTRRLARRA